jgi:hypothetical protein
MVLALLRGAFLKQYCLSETQWSELYYAGQSKFLFFLSLFVQRKKQRKGAENANFYLFVRPLHEAIKAPPKSQKFAPFPGCPRTYHIQFLNHAI